ncbi:extracellular solute-binding protein [Nocardioides terrisoli]|uniref:extracellular solute-binding protein n=1 Tax=Nocardioides terrisoli TaxID=3388267 RepID=UPI00287BB0AD|nr:extracellular solute-binding protein [Nocardioides marmorisolisilvae]
MSPQEPHPSRRIRRTLAVAAALAMAGGVLTACGGSSGKPTLTWYINPDPSQPANFKGPFGQAGIAARCSTSKYTIQVQELPGDATQQRIQLARRLAAGDTGIDLMSLDPVFTGEFANAGFLAPLPDSLQSSLKSVTLPGAVSGATWGGRLAVAPLWANTQLLWYRKSFAQKAGLDMSKPVTWDQIIKAASQNGGTVGVQANKYEGYSVWINALVAGAGGSIIQNAAKGDNATITIDSTAGKQAAAVIDELSHSKAAEGDLSVSNEGTVLGPFATPQGAFQVNWTFIYANYKADKATFNDLGWTRYPETVAGKPSRPPLGGINIGINKATTHRADAYAATRCITSEANQVRYAIETGNMPARTSAYNAPDLRKAYPANLLAAFRSSLQAAAPRPVSPYWSDISSAIQSTWHPPTSVNSSTPQKSASFISDVLKGRKLL